MTIQSAAFYPGDSATALRWKAAGRVKAIGVHATAPKSERNLSIFFPSDRVKTTVIRTKIVLVTFFVICLFFDLGQFAYK